MRVALMSFFHEVVGEGVEGTKGIFFVDEFLLGRVLLIFIFRLIFVIAERFFIFIVCSHIIANAFVYFLVNDGGSVRVFLQRLTPLRLLHPPVQ